MKFHEASILALAPELTSIPIRSPETSIILAEAVRRQRQAAEEKPRTRALRGVFAGLLGRRSLESPIPDANVSVVLTVNGPLVYQW
jgi:hypothetical protein